MAYHQNHFHRFVLVSGIVLGLLVTGGYEATANSSAANGNDYNSNHMVITFSHSALAHNQVTSQKSNQQQSSVPKQPAQNNQRLLPKRTVSTYHQVLNGMNHYYNRAKVAKPKEETSSQQYVKRNLPALKSGSADAHQPSSQGSSQVHDEHYRQSFHHSSSVRNAHLIISFSTPDDQEYPMDAETASNRSANSSGYFNHTNSSEQQKSTQLNDDASNVNNQVGDWFRDGLSDSELNARNWISWRESNDRWDVLSYGGYCIGYFQLSPRYLGYVNGHLNLDHQHQVQAADQYTRSKYGSWAAAKQFWLGHRWY